ncbi:hypothetical protein [Streptomyces sp. NPDC102370]|uniref:hypothetical protein n=1 Tax=Streptomyces sp. NPDC102370 TaxID=3366163 RepID=UPI00381BB897
MSSTRRASKRARIQRRAENDQMRTARRDSLAVLLSRAQRNVPLTADEAALLRAAVEAEIREGDAARQAERGQQRAADRERERATAAEAAIVEAEDERDRQHDRAEQAIRRAVEEYDRRQTAEAALARVRALAADMRTWCSPHGIATQYADDIERALAEQQVPRLAAEQPRAAVDVAPGVAVIRDRAAEQRAEEAEGKLSESETLGHRLLQRAERAEEELTAARAQLTRSENAREALRDRIEGEKRRGDQAEELQRIAHQTSNAAEQARAEAEQRLAAQHDAHDARRRALADALGRSADTSWPALIEHATEAQQWATSAAVRADRKRADEAEQRLALIRDMADAWEHRLPATIRTATAAAAIRNAANGDYRPVMFAVTDPPTDALATMEQRAQEAEKAAKAWEHAARRYANNLDAARDRADEAEHRAGRYRLAWLAARRDRKADRAAMAAERPYVEAGQRALAGLTAAEAADNMRQWAAAGMSAAQPVTLATPCANPDCEHPRNWHIGTPGGVCVARGGACPCPGFVAPTAQGATR